MWLDRIQITKEKKNEIVQLLACALIIFLVFQRKLLFILMQLTWIALIIYISYKLIYWGYVLCQWLF